MDKYALDELRTILFLDSNAEYVKIAARKITDYYRYSYRETYEGNRIDLDPESLYILDEIFHRIINIAEYIDGLSKTIVYYLSLIGFLLCFYNQIERLEEKKISDYKQVFLENGKIVFYRGHNNAEWRLIPSVLRGLNKTIVLNDDYYFKLLDNDGTEEKFNEYIRTPDTNTYDKYAFMQHASSYSPFIDFTTNPIISTSFALSNASSFNDFRGNDSAIIVLNNKDESNFIRNKKDAKYFLKNDFNIRIINSKYFKLGEKYMLEKSDGTYETLCITSYFDLINELRPEYKIITVPTNDRMKYQKGLFLCFYNCLCVNSTIWYELNKDASFLKFIIPRRTKRKMLDSIYKEQRQYDPEHLLDPYLTFKE